MFSLLSTSCLLKLPIVSVNSLVTSTEEKEDIEIQAFRAQLSCIDFRLPIVDRVLVIVDFRPVIGYSRCQPGIYSIVCTTNQNLILKYTPSRRDADFRIFHYG